jgi:hypothetical protein
LAGNLLEFQKRLDRARCSRAMIAANIAKLPELLRRA